MPGEVIHIDFRGDSPHRARGRIGPNCLIQTRAALEELEGRIRGGQIYRGSGLPESPPNAMVPETRFIALVDHIRAQLPRNRAEAVLNAAGTKTAEYVLSHRIPGWVQVLLGLLPRRVSLPLLLDAIKKHAWTFAGSGAVRVTGPYPYQIEMIDCPTCRGNRRPPLAGGYYAAAFERLLQLVSPAVRVREHACSASGSAQCRFTIHMEIP